MISKTTIDLLAEEDIELPSDVSPMRIDDIFAPLGEDEDGSDTHLHTEAKLSTRKKLHILDWASIDRQLRSYGFNRLDHLSLSLMDEDARKHITDGRSDAGFDFGSDSIPFSVKYNVAIALSYAEAIGILSHLKTCEIYASPEVERVFRKHGQRILPGLSRINFGELPLDMKRELVWPMVQNLYRALTVRKAAQAFPEGIPGKLAYEALVSECENDQLASQLSHLNALKYSNYEKVYFSDPSDLEVKYHLALYCLNHIGEIKPRQTPPPQEDERKSMDDQQQQADNFKRLEEEYIAAFRRLNKNRSFWDKVNLEDLFEMGRDVMEAIKEEVKNFAQLKQGIISRLAGQSKVAIEDEELLRITHGQNPDFEFASRYLSMFFQPSDYYSILGLDSAMATEKDVKDAFKRQAKIYHPDKNPNDPDKDAKEKRFKLLTAAKDALLKRLRSGKETPSFRDDVSLTSYLGSISKLFGEYAADENTYQRREKSEALKDRHMGKIPHTPEEMGKIPHTPEEQEEAETTQDIYQGKEEAEMETDGSITQDHIGEEVYLGPYFEEMRILESMIDGWAGKDVLVMGAGREPDDFSIPVILSRMGANVSAVDLNYRGPAEYQGCQYYRMSADRVNEIFEEGKFDIVISTAMFGAPFTNWALREFSINPFDPGIRDRIRNLELEVIKKLLMLTRDGGIHLHYNRDLNPQSWNFSEDDLKQIGCGSAFHPEDLPYSRRTWFLRK